MMTDVDGPATDGAVREALERIFSETGLAPPQQIRRRPSEYRTSFPLEELDLTLESGESLRLAFKRLGWEGLDEQGSLAKPGFLHDPRREAAVYASVLEMVTGAPRHYGSVVEPERDRYWLFIEWVEGRELYQVGERGLWEEAARWLGRMHSSLAAEAPRHAEVGRLLDHDAAFYRRWMERAREFARDSAAAAGRAEAVDWLAERHDTVVEALTAEPRTVIHGEFYASNVLVDADPTIPRVAPVDWELAAVGPGLTDLAALVSGGWAREDREAIVAAYGSETGAAPDRLDYARLQLAIQWLGWAPAAWTPPEGQRHDWLAEAISLAEALGI
jgi:aminoglycoside phosphotransferase (APT) family kinase protein